MASQEQFLNVIDRDEAERRLHSALRLEPLGEESVPLSAALGRILARNVASPTDVPSFDRSDVDGFAVQAADTFGASEEDPRILQLLDEEIVTGAVPCGELFPSTAMSIATGGMMPRGADAVVMIEHSDVEGAKLTIRRAVTAGAHVTFAGTDITAGETVLRRDTVLTSRETGVLAAIGVSDVFVWRKPRVGVLSTGNEIIPPGDTMRPGLVYDSNARSIADAVREVGGDPVELGIIGDRLELLRTAILRAVETCDLVLLSGGTSKGAGDLSYQVVREWTDPGIVAHGVALKPGKPLCLAVTRGKAVIILPGFPTSAIFTFHEFVAPIIRRLAGGRASQRDTATARLAIKVNSEIGRTEYLLVGLVETRGHMDSSHTRYTAFPMGKGSGSVTAFSRADGFVVINRHEELIPASSLVEVHLLGPELQLADLNVMGSHCLGLDYLLSQLQADGWRVKFVAIGSTAGLDAVRRGECDLAGIHLLDPLTQEYNRPFVSDELQWIPGYRRMQGIVFRPGDARFEGRSLESALAVVQNEPRCRMINRNQGSGTRILIDQLLGGAKPAGYAVQPRNHNAVVAAVKQGRADWGVAIEIVARHANLGFLECREERYDFVTSQVHPMRPALRAFLSMLTQPVTRQELEKRGFRFEPDAR